ncbi:alkaline phosphatase, tissue-nonspecific isozyme-like isoform X2 [Ornithodoros turicata]
MLLRPEVVDVPAKNVIVFVGDGMGLATVTAARIYSGQLQNRSGEENMLSFDQFPYTAFVKTYAVDKQVVDSAASATAIFTGVKTNFALLGLSAKANLSDCNSSIGNDVYSFMARAQLKDKDTGFVTSTRVTHATPAALYSHSAHREWEADSKMPGEASRCKDIARQLVEDAPGNKFKVILGGGLQYLKSTSSSPTGIRQDGRDLVKEWLSRNSKAKFVRTAQELAGVDVNSTDYLMGLFADDHMEYALKRTMDQPSLPQMVETAIRMLKKNPNGFALMVEGGRIDHGHHDNRAILAIAEAEELSRAVHLARTMTSTRDTLILVTADHSHSFVLSGYPVRGNPITGTAGTALDNMTYTSLAYTNGPSKSVRSEQDSELSQSVDYQQPVLVPLASETHGGEDVALYASGPMAHLVRGVIEQNAIAHIIDYAACLGDSSEKMSRCEVNSATAAVVNHLVVLVLATLAIFFH